MIQANKRPTCCNTFIASCGVMAPLVISSSRESVRAIPMLIFRKWISQERWAKDRFLWLARNVRGSTIEFIVGCGHPRSFRLSCEEMYRKNKKEVFLSSFWNLGSYQWRCPQYANVVKMVVADEVTVPKQTWLIRLWHDWRLCLWLPVGHCIPRFITAWLISELRLQDRISEQNPWQRLQPIHINSLSPSKMHMQCRNRMAFIWPQLLRWL